MREKTVEIGLYGIGVIFLIIILYPLYFIVIASVSEPSAVLAGEVWFYPRCITLDGYRELLKNEKIWTGYRNTVFYTIVGTTVSMLVTVPAAYALSRRDFKGRKPFMMFFLITMFFNGGLIPTYMTVTKTLHMGDTFWVMLLPFCVNVFNLIIMRTFFESSIPQELWEAAQLDGCSSIYYLGRVVLPLSKAVLSVIMLYYVVAKWNEYFTALIYVRNNRLIPLQIVLRDILIQNESMASNMMGAEAIEAAKKANLIKYSSIIVGTLPMMILYPFLQKYFEKGVMIGAVKG